MSPIHPGLYLAPPTKSSPQSSPPTAPLIAQTPHPSFVGIHPDVEAMENLIDYHELYYNVDNQFKYGALHPPPILISTKPTRTTLPAHRAYFLPVYSKYIAHNPYQIASQMDYDPSSLVTDYTPPILLEDGVADPMDEATPLAINDTNLHDFKVPIRPSTSLPSRLPPTIHPIDKANASLP